MSRFNGHVAAVTWLTLLGRPLDHPESKLYQSPREWRGIVEIKEKKNSKASAGAGGGMDDFDY